jgi:predicted DNA-binding ribbon-helix-helix protein
MSFGRGRIQPRTIYVHGHPTSVRIEEKWWAMLREIAGTRGVTIKSVIESVIVSKDPKESLAAALRFFIAQYFRNRDGLYYFLDVTHGTRRPRSRPRGISDTGRTPRPRAA